VLEAFGQLTDAVRKGGTALGPEGLLEPANPAWVEFARAMAPLQKLPGEWIASIVEAEARAGQRLRVLDIAAGHGLFGIAVATRLPQAEVVAVDWPNVLEVARENAARFGVDGRWRALAGDAFTVDYGKDYDVALLANILHHFDSPTCVTLLKKVRAALKSGGRAIAVEFVPNEDRVSPPLPAMFALTMLAVTPSGDAYTFAEYERLFRQAGFPRSEMHQHPHLPQRMIVARA
jgi:2-polyprenyl-3-methyl-5-hydroxy-6-metoxy-1,4-benzoquinol methylase